MCVVNFGKKLKINKEEKLVLAKIVFFFFFYANDIKARHEQGYV